MKKLLKEQTHVLSFSKSLVFVCLLLFFNSGRSCWFTIYETLLHPGSYCLSQLSKLADKKLKNQQELKPKKVQKAKTVELYRCIFRNKLNPYSLVERLLIWGFISSLLGDSLGFVSKLVIFYQLKEGSWTMVNNIVCI